MRNERLKRELLEFVRLEFGSEPWTAKSVAERIAAKGEAAPLAVRVLLSGSHAAIRIGRCTQETPEFFERVGLLRDGHLWRVRS